MTNYAKLNLLAVVGMPAAATLAAAITPALGSLNAGGFLAVFVMNLMPMLIGGLAAGLLLRGARKVAGAGAGIALLPSVVPALFGAVWYLWRAVMPEEIAPGREYLAGPQYLLIMVIGLWIVAWVAGRIARAGKIR